ncbi:S8 family serine peptidase [Bacillus timonensis]|uniref:S8 family serine peptidase n=1 Tax=Bacillus timonensis TaxID=1033734 RepID=UPI0002893796|nr:S8 family serine peptidase [Bacillus timonensis]
MRKNWIIAVLLFFGLMGLTVGHYKDNRLPEEKVFQISNNHEAVQTWMEKHQVGGRVSVTSINNESPQLIESSVKKTNENWEVTYQANTGKNPMFLRVTVAGNGEIQSIKEEDRVVILFKDEVNLTPIENAEGKIIDVTEEIPVASATVPSETVNELEDNPDIVAVEDDVLLSIHQQNADWGIETVRTPSAWKANYSGKGVKIAIIDTGIDLEHQDLKLAGGASFVSYTDSFHDDEGHGTHVAGIIGAQNNSIGSIGIAYNSSLFAVKVLDSNGDGYLSDIIEGIDWAISNKMDIINLSLGSDTHSPALKTAVDKAYQQNILVVASAGNSGAFETIDTIGYPAKYDSTIAVGAVGPNLQYANFSSSGPSLEVVAPGVNIISTYAGNTYAKLSGTSMAAPYVSGNLALLKQAHPDMSPQQLRTLLHLNVKDLGLFGRDRFYGYGLIQSSSSDSIHGRSRYETSVRISKRGWNEGSDTVILGRGDIPIDTLTGSVLASKLNAPILLTKPTALPIEVLEEMERLSPKTIIIIGGEMAISKNIEEQLSSIGYSVQRISGTSRYNTALRIANEIQGNGEIFLTTGENSPDPLSIAPYAGLMKAPILLTGKSSLPEEVRDYIQQHRIEKATIIGGKLSVSDDIEDELKELGIMQIERISGLNRYATSIAIVNKYHNILSGPIFIASGESFVDALPGAPLATKTNSPILLVHKDRVSNEIKDMLKGYQQMPHLSFLGGYSVISIETRAEMEKLGQDL